ncbi:MAG: YCF48-related protein [Planctomycetota bacterium]|nr:YCF48-related protein [Planctomycetota bacterium]
MQILNFLTACACFVATATAQATWTRQSPLPYPPQLNPEEVAFSGTRGYIVGSSNHLLETTDGGDTWHERVLTGATYNDGGYYAVSFSGPLDGWIVGDNLSWTNSCFKTSDGGVTWTQVNILAYSQWSHVDFVSPTRGWVGAWGNLYFTNDGGTSWNPQSFGVVDRIDSMNFYDSNIGVLSSAGALRRTQNGGQTWTLVHGHEAFAIEWLDATTVIASTISFGGPDFARSTDAGLSWQPIQVPGVDLQAPVRVDATTVIAGTQFGDLYRSTDAGLTWTSVWNSGKTGSVNDGHFTSPTDGYVVESGNLILRTSDAGQTWRYVSSGLGTKFEDVKMFDAQRGWSRALRSCARKTAGARGFRRRPRARSRPDRSGISRSSRPHSPSRRATAACS